MSNVIFTDGGSFPEPWIALDAAGKLAHFDLSECERIAGLWPACNPPEQYQHILIARTVLAAYRAGIERAAKILESDQLNWGSDVDLAAAIRGLLK